MRFIANLADPDDTRLTNFMGQSGHPASPNYADQLEAWARVEAIRLPMSDEAVARATVHTLTLTP
jgi:penicillin amidase